MKVKIEKRAEAYKLMNSLKSQGTSKSDILKEVVSKTGVPYATVYGWYEYGNSPFGKRKLKNCKELFYVLGALMGDGCAYYWAKGKSYMVLLVGEKEFIEKYSNKLFICTGSKVKGYPALSNRVPSERTTYKYPVFPDVKQRGCVFHCHG